MPARDGTGPLGRGHTGRGIGYCAGYGAGVYRAGRCLGQGRGFRNRRFWTSPGRTVDRIIAECSAAPTREAQKQCLRNEADLLQNRVDNIRKWLNEMDGFQKQEPT